ncbi:hydrogenase maturation carbamoyltransferase HypF [Pseudonocardia autotrophica]|uniref:Carbamoyltransferase n=3 Tax=Pseudonocardiaceae TaxID=2070 RepID=A0A1Y2MHI5_PSEAH|nr:Carbamoyltransferase HypF [Pseudonocardia autotrophica]TDN76390.1 hydrogenase maturation carbamoyltransferase HypF [Pseudonocardia autotrophica]BBG00380.1 carbamoyltransferase [Pseudonocardia autotrophica]GEC28439.1 carbamoyltransferase [Pseudonocardia saturnea]
MDALMLTGAAQVRRRFTVTGVVQGVGFRPFVHRTARELGLGGFVGNDSAAVFAEVQGSAVAVGDFTRRLRTDAPPLAVVSDLSWVDIEPGADDEGFRIVASGASDGSATAIPPDVAVCADCLSELFDTTDRRYRHPFITCTNCGPRFTIIRGLPYDRPATTMADFAMCPRCAAEYRDPADRRFHAQPVACPQCGPSLWLLDAAQRISGPPDAALGAAQAAIRSGRVVAVKGVGGYHLACAADNESAVTALRSRKARGGKPFAVLVRDLETARRYAEIDDAEAAVLLSPARPVVLLHRRPGAPVAPAVAPGSPLLGLMLPYTPVHHLLLTPVPGTADPAPEAVVLTSANLSDEPICYTDEDARERLPALCDAVLDHDRSIHVPCDDSVVRVVDGHELPIRRSRGFAPLPIDLGRDGPRVLAVGGELKNTFCLTDGRRAFCSAHIGDMGSLETLRAFERSLSQLSGLRGIPERLAADLHPGYQTRSWAERAAGDRPLDLVQHHHAHVLSLLAEHGRLGEPVVGVAFDGTGYGCDATVWGGEILLLGPDGHRFVRAGHLTAVPLPGGDVAVRNPWRMALSHLRSAGVPWTTDLPPVQAASPGELGLLESQLDSGLGCVDTTSMGRLFDAVASLLGVRHRIGYEGQAAIELEVLACSSAFKPELTHRLRLVVGSDGSIDTRPMIRAIARAIRSGTDGAADVARAFHDAVAVAVGQVVTGVAGPVRVVGLTGGVFQNVLLLRACRARLEEEGFEVLTHRVVPPNDGGLALGQAAAGVLRALAERHEFELKE